MNHWKNVSVVDLHGYYFWGIVKNDYKLKISLTRNVVEIICWVFFDFICLSKLFCRFLYRNTKIYELFVPFVTQALLGVALVIKGL